MSELIIEPRFFDDLLTAETGIDLSKIEWYRKHLNDRCMHSWRIEYPGRVWRSPTTGEPLRECVSVHEYFRRLGLKDIKTNLRPEALRRYRYAAINPWGFVGYQLGEALLIETGHYRALRVAYRDENGRVKAVDSYYTGDLPAERWRQSARERCHRPYGKGDEILATDVNRWCGRFTGKDGLDSLAALKTPEVQEAVFRAALTHNLSRIRRRMSDASAELGCVIRDRSKLSVTEITLSGCLAAAHLCGADGLADYLLNGIEASDETGTTLCRYLQRFSGYAVRGEDKMCSAKKAGGYVVL